MVSPNKIKMVSNFNDEISMSDIFWREIMARKILWVPAVSCEKLYISLRVCVDSFLYQTWCVAWFFRQYNMKISGDLLMKIKIIIFKLIIIDLFIQGSFAARLIFCVFFLPQHQWDDLKPYAKDMNIERKGNLIIIWWEVKSTDNTLWSHQNFFKLDETCVYDSWNMTKSVKKKLNWIVADWEIYFNLFRKLNRPTFPHW